MASEFIATRRVEFSDTDMAGIVHFAQFFRYMEVTEHEFWRSIGLSVFTTIDGETYTIPRVHVECDYLLPLRFEDVVEIHLRVRELKSKVISYSFDFHRRQDGGRELVARGSVTAVCVRVDRATGQFQSVPIPAMIAERIEAVPAVG